MPTEFFIVKNIVVFIWINQFVAIRDVLTSSFSACFVLPRGRRPSWAIWIYLTALSNALFCTTSELLPKYLSTTGNDATSLSKWHRVVYILHHFFIKVEERFDDKVSALLGISAIMKIMTLPMYLLYLVFLTPSKFYSDHVSSKFEKSSS